MSETETNALFCVLITFTILTTPSLSATDTFVFGGCSTLKFTPGTPYESNLNTLLSSIVNGATFNTYSNFTVQGSTRQDTIYGIFQCRGDLGNSDCSSCVSRAVSQLGTICLDASGGVLQLEGCFVKYDNASFIGVEDKTLVVKKCGPSIGYDDPNAMNGRDAVLGYLGSNGGDYRVGGSGNTQGVAQCTGDLSTSECQDCLAAAIGRLQTDCGMASSGEVYLAKCYARYSMGGSSTGKSPNDNNNNNNDEIDKTLAIILGLIAGVILLVIFLSCLGKECRKLQDGK